MINLIRKNKNIIKLVLLGVLIRLILMFVFNSIYDFFNILALSKSIADTGNLTDGFFVLKRNSLQPQLYGKIYYQISALWLFLLDKIKILQIDYLFDTKPYQGIATYMEGLFYWGPALYQLISIKLVQFFYDFILLFYLYKTAKIINPQKATKTILFWAINPFLIIVPYAVFQSDLAMLAFFMAGIYFWISNKKLSAFFFLALGAIIKQVPILILPFAIISFSKNIKSFLINSAMAGLFYFVLGQPWAKDTILLKQFFLMSKESMVILDFQLNSVSIFLFLYFCLILTFVFKKKAITLKPVNVIYFVVLLLSVVYITEGSEFLFPQFNIWIMPFLAILALNKPEYGLMLAAPIVGFFKRVVIGVDLTGLLRPTFGYGLNHIPDYKYFIGSLINPEIIGLIMTTIMTTLYFILILMIINDLFEIKKLEYIKTHKISHYISLDKVAIYIVVGYMLLFITDFTIKSRLSIIPTTAYQTDNKELPLTNKPLIVNVRNSPGKTITALDIRARKNEITYADFTTFRFRDKNNKIILEQKVSDYLFPVPDEDFIILLDKPIKNKEFSIEIFKEKGYNQIVFYEAKTIPDIIGGSIYDNPVSEDVVNINFKNNVFILKFRGQYTFKDMWKGIVYHLNNKPKFFALYFTLIMLVGGSIIFIKRIKPL